MRLSRLSRGKVVALLVVLAMFAVSLVYREWVVANVVQEVDVEGMRVIRMRVGTGVDGRVEVFGDPEATKVDIESVAALDTYLSNHNRRDVYVVLHYLPGPDGKLCEAINSILLERRVAFSVSDDADGRDIDVSARLTAVARQLGRLRDRR
ncbi:MAG: hypothetical protein ACK53T_04605 [Planctomycetota bacterium]|jgi:hypothetical protein